jgi:hypothetical protein
LRRDDRTWAHRFLPWEIVTVPGWTTAKICTKREAARTTMAP